MSKEDIIVLKHILVLLPGRKQHVGHLLVVARDPTYETSMKTKTMFRRGGDEVPPKNEVAQARVSARPTDEHLVVSPGSMKTWNFCRRVNPRLNPLRVAYGHKSNTLMGMGLIMSILLKMKITKCRTTSWQKM
ncbi:unnamed protein product [Amoebophrya sp. A25]|nr:unnamed protein product [Amoebophrya sp. A25]|eukprot:GSA25T00018892001.1